MNPEHSHIDPQASIWQLTNSWGSWGLVQRVLHWASALVILSLIGLGLYITNALTETDFETLMERARLTYTHKAWGFVAFCLGVLRILWRLANPTPDLPDEMAPWERRFAHAGHGMLYLLIIAMPVSGWLMATSSELQETFGLENKVTLEILFGESAGAWLVGLLGWEDGFLLAMPDPFVPGDEKLSEIFKTAHMVIGYALIAVVLGHIAAALKHAIVNRDGVLGRMVRGK